MAPGTPAPWINLASALTALGQPRAARAAARRALALAPDDADALYALGRAEAACDEPVAARAAFLACTRARPWFADAWVDLGLACYRLGQVADTMRAMHQALRAVPGHGAAEANLAAFRLLRGETDAALARLRGVIERDPGCIPARINLANALLLDREAVEALALLEGSPPAGRDGAHWRAHRASTLVEQILAAHPQVQGAGERETIHLLTSRLGPAAQTLAALDADTLSTEAEAFLTELHALAPQAPVILDKMPDNARYLGFIATLLPGARIIHCRRDPRDSGLSIFQIRFFGYHPYAHDLADLGWAIGQHERLMAHWRAVLPGTIFDVALTDWVADFDATLAKLLRFLDLPHDPACETFYRHQRRVRTASAEQVRAPVNARGIGRWRRYAEELAPMLAELETAGIVERAP